MSEKLTEAERETLREVTSTITDGLWTEEHDPLLFAVVEAILAARLARVEALHHCRDETVARPICDVCWDDAFMGHASWPCATIRALRSDAHTEQKGEGE